MFTLHSFTDLLQFLKTQKSLKLRNSKFGKIRFFTEFEKWHSGSKFEEQNSAVRSNIRQHSPTSNQVISHNMAWHHMTSHGMTWQEMTSHNITWHGITRHDIILRDYILYRELFDITRKDKTQENYMTSRKKIATAMWSCVE